MWHVLLGNGKFFAELTSVDERISCEVQAGRCPHCGGRLDRSDYGRKPRGGLGEAEESWSRRFSYCCSVDGCRRRVTPPSVRFLGRKVYAAPYVVLSLVVEAASQRIASARTLRRWQAWWQTIFIASARWREGGAALMPSVDERQLPSSLLSRFKGAGSEALTSMLKWISPVTTSSYSRGTIGM